MKKQIIFKVKGQRYAFTRTGKLCLLFLGLLYALFLGELLIKIFIRFPLEKEYMIFPFRDYKPIPKAQLDRDLLWKPDKLYFYNEEKADLRIICIGDSITQGYRNPYQNFKREETWVYKTEQRLQNDFKSKHVEMMNFGVGGFTSLQGMRYLGKITTFKPDLVISLFGQNDNCGVFFYQDKEQKIPTDRKKNWRSNVYLLLKNFSMINKMFHSHINRVSPEDFYSNCEEMLKTAKTNDFQITFCAPFVFNKANNRIEYLYKYERMLENLSRKYNCKIIFLAGRLNGYQKPSRLFIDNCHLSKKGHVITAQLIYSCIKDECGKIINKKIN